MSLLCTEDFWDRMFCFMKNWMINFWQRIHYVVVQIFANFLDQHSFSFLFLFAIKGFQYQYLFQYPSSPSIFVPSCKTMPQQD